MDGTKSVVPTMVCLQLRAVGVRPPPVTGKTPGVYLGSAHSAILMLAE